MAFPTDRLAEAIAHTVMNRAVVERSDACACVACLARFTPAEISHWWSDFDGDGLSDAGEAGGRHPTRGDTACCPACGGDDVIGSASGCELSDALLRAVRDYWYGPNPDNYLGGRAAPV